MLPEPALEAPVPLFVPVKISCKPWDARQPIKTPSDP